MTKRKDADGAAKSAPVILDRDAILAADDLKKELVEVPEWGGSVYVREMSADERDQWEATTIDDDGMPLSAKQRVLSLRSTLCAHSVCDANGVRLFTADDIEALGQKSTEAVERLFAVSRRLNKIFEVDIEELVKNSAGAPKGGST